MFRRDCCGGSSQNDDINIVLNQLPDQVWKSVAAAVSGAIFNDKVLSLNISKLPKTVPESTEQGGIFLRRYRFQHADSPHLRRLLRSRRNRPRGRRAAQQRDEVAAL